MPCSNLMPGSNLITPLCHSTTRVTLEHDLHARWQVVLWEQRLTVYARKHMLETKEGDKEGDKRPPIHSVQTSCSRTGVGGVLGNKGGLVAKLGIYDTTICIVSAHLAAHAHKLAARNDDCQVCVALHSPHCGIGWDPTLGGGSMAVGVLLRMPPVRVATRMSVTAAAVSLWRSQSHCLLPFVWGRRS